jgi:sporulation protein YlmC with PRC-barrel domain
MQAHNSRKDGKKMKVQNPQELVGKEVFDTNGNTVGRVDKYWKSWNDEYPGYFFGIRPNENTKDTWFRGTNKLVPIYSDYIKDCGDQITLNKTTEQLGRFWNKAVPCGNTTCPTDQLVDKPIYDKNHSRVGTFYGWVESDGTYKHYGMFVDPYICDTWHMPYNTMMPMPTNFIQEVKDTITLDKTLDELRDYWKNQFNFK